MNQLLKGVSKTSHQGGLRKEAHHTVTETHHQSRVLGHSTEQHIGAHSGVNEYNRFGAPTGDYDIHDDRSLLKFVNAIEHKHDFYEYL